MYLIFFFFFNDTATTEIYTLSLHDALPICRSMKRRSSSSSRRPAAWASGRWPLAATASRLSNHSSATDRKSTRLNSSHANISYAVFCLKKKKKKCNKFYVCQYDDHPAETLR